MRCATHLGAVDGVSASPQHQTRGERAAQQRGAPLGIGHGVDGGAQRLEAAPSPCPVLLPRLCSVLGEVRAPHGRVLPPVRLGVEDWREHHVAAADELAYLAPLVHRPLVLVLGGGRVLVERTPVDPHRHLDAQGQWRMPAAAHAATQRLERRDNERVLAFVLVVGVRAVGHAAGPRPHMRDEDEGGVGGEVGAVAAKVGVALARPPVLVLGLRAEAGQPAVCLELRERDEAGSHPSAGRRLQGVGAPRF